MLVAVNFYIPFSWSSFGVIVLPSTSWRAYFPAVTKEKYLEVRPSSSVFITTQKPGKETKKLSKERWQIWAYTCTQIKDKMLIPPGKSALPLRRTLRPLELRISD